MLKEKSHKIITAILMLTVFLSVCAFAGRRMDKSVWDGVYTTDQAARGKTAFEANCSSCHMVSSDFGGDTFMSKWKDHSAFDLFDAMSTQMPMDRPGALDKGMYADIVSYMFQTNAFPPGTTELAPDPDALKQIHIDAKPPASSNAGSTDAGAANATAPKSVWDAVYTDDQATRGKAAFEANCSSCHMISSDFAGDTFMTKWKDHSAFDLFDTMSTQMPMDRPGALDKSMYADILSYMFQTNTFPSGSKELTPDPDALKGIRIEPKPLRSK